MFSYFKNILDLNKLKAEKKETLEERNRSFGAYTSIVDSSASSLEKFSNFYMKQALIFIGAELYILFSKNIFTADTDPILMITFFTVLKISIFLFGFSFLIFSLITIRALTQSAGSIKHRFFIDSDERKKTDQMIKSMDDFQTSWGNLIPLYKTAVLCWGGGVSLGVGVALVVLLFAV